MKKKEPVRMYNFSDARLNTLGNEKIGYMRRDAEAFERFGITADLLDTLETELNAFESTLTDYQTLVRYTNTGQDIWETSDVAKYNDYIIYNTLSGEPPIEPPVV